MTTWADPADPNGPASTVTFDIAPFGDIVRLTITHTDLTDDAEHQAAASGWSAVLSNLKTLLETGQVLPEKPWDMP